MWRKLTITGIFGTAAYILHVVLGGILWKGYNHLMQPISDLTALGAPDRTMLLQITRIYELFSIIFAFSAYTVLKRFAPRLARVGMLLFLLMHVVSVSYAFFPEDLPGSVLTFTGLMHIVVTGLIAPLSIVSILFMGLGMRRVKTFGGYGVYSLITSAILLCAGGFSVFLMAGGLPYFGLFERINIGSLQVWMAVTAWKLFSSGFVRESSKEQ